MEEKEKQDNKTFKNSYKTYNFKNEILIVATFCKLGV